MAEESEIVHAVMSSSVPLLLNALKKGEDVNRLIDSGMTLLGQAILIGNEEIIQILIDAEHFLPPENPNDTKPSPPVSIDWVTLRLRENEQAEDAASSSGAFAKKENSQPDCQTLNAIRLFDRLRRNYLRRHRCDINLPDYFDRMPIHYAVQTDNLNVLKKLMDAGVIVNVSDSNNLTPLHLAVCRNNDIMVESLLRAGCRVNSKAHDKSSALHMACFHGYMGSVNILLRYNAEINSKDVLERTPLFIAVSQSHYSIVELLLRGGATVNTTEIHGSTPLCMAVWHRNFELTQVLLSAGAKVTPNQNLLHHTIRHKSIRIFELLMQHAACLNFYDECGDTPLHAAVRTKEMVFVRMLIHNGARTMSRCTTIGTYPLHIAADVITDDEIDLFSEMLQLFLNYNADLDCQSHLDGDTVLYRAILRGKYQMSKELIRQGCNPNLGHIYSCDIDLMGLAVRQVDTRFIKLLLYSGYSRLYNSPAVRYANTHRNDLPGISEYFSAFQREPMSLTSLCRIVIRRSLGQNLVPKVRGMNLPTAYKEFLLFMGPDFA